jgi:hypothetical protein
METDALQVGARKFSGNHSRKRAFFYGSWLLFVRVLAPVKNLSEMMIRRKVRVPDTRKLLKDAKPGDILLFQRARGLNRLITWFSRSRFYHVGIYADGTFVVEARPSGVVRRDLSLSGSESHFRVIPAPQNKGEEALQWAQTQIGDSYAPLSVLALVCDRIFRNWNLNITQPDQYSCGEFVAMAFEESGVRLFPQRAVEQVAPWDFASLLPSVDERIGANSG